jgi:hypothetical protein
MVPVPQLFNEVKKPSAISESVKKSKPAVGERVGRRDRLGSPVLKKTTKKEVKFIDSAGKGNF